jgi:hypothetical protein
VTAIRSCGAPNEITIAPIIAAFHKTGATYERKNRP